MLTGLLLVQMTWRPLNLSAQANDEKSIRALNIQHIEDAVMIADISVAGKSVKCGLFVKRLR
jgi:hypothetical protein